MFTHQYFSQAIAPGTNGIPDAGFNSFHTNIGWGLPFSANNEMHARQRRLVNLNGKIKACTAKGIPENRLNLLAVFGIELFARDKHQAGEKAPVALAPDKYADLAALLDRKSTRLNSSHVAI